MIVSITFIDGTQIVHHDVEFTFTQEILFCVEMRNITHKYGMAQIRVIEEVNRK